MSNFGKYACLDNGYILPNYTISFLPLEFKFSAVELVTICRTFHGGKLEKDNTE